MIVLLLSIALIVALVAIFFTRLNKKKENPTSPVLPPDQIPGEDKPKPHIPFDKKDTVETKMRDPKTGRFVKKS